MESKKFKKATEKKIQELLNMYKKGDVPETDVGFILENQEIIQKHFNISFGSKNKARKPTELNSL